jgi:hypothetical protein
MACNAKGRPPERFGPPRAVDGRVEWGKPKPSRVTMSEARDYVLELTREALVLAEGSETRLTQLVRRATRIVALRNDFDNAWWLQLEMTTLTDKSRVQAIEAQYRQHYTITEFQQRRTGFLGNYVRDRSANRVPQKERSTNRLYAASIPTLEDVAAGAERDLVNHKAQQRGGERAGDAIAEADKQLATYRTVIANIRQRVFSLLCEVEVQLVHGQSQSNAFERNRQYVEGRLGALCPQALTDFTAACWKLADRTPLGRAEAVSGCRHMMSALADRLYPAGPEIPPVSQGKPRASEENHIKRLRRLVLERLEGKNGDALSTQIRDLGARLFEIDDMTSRGITATLSDFEADQCVIQTYLTIGDMLRVADRTSALLAPDNPSSD